MEEKKSKLKKRVRPSSVTKAPVKKEREEIASKAQLKKRRRIRPREENDDVKVENPFSLFKKSGKDLTMQQVCRMFDVTPMTVYGWRKKHKLPWYHLDGGKKPPVRFDEGQILNWAKCYGANIVNDDYLEIE